MRLHPDASARPQMMLKDFIERIFRPGHYARRRRREFLDKHVGDFLAIPLADGSSCGFARLIHSGYLACYDLKSESVPPLEQIESAKVLFTLGFNNRVIETGRWKILGNKPLPPELNVPVRFFREDPITGSADIWVGDKRVPYAGEDLSKMERWVSWDAPGIEERLSDHFAGKPNWRVESYKYPQRGRIPPLERKP